MDHQANYNLHQMYRELYWQHNELQIIATPEAIAEALKLQLRMDAICRALGYIPAA